MRGPSICENDVKDMNVGDCFGGKEDEPSELKLGGAKQPSRRATGGRREKGARVEVEWRRRNLLTWHKLPWIGREEEAGRDKSRNDDGMVGRPHAHDKWTGQDRTDRE
jgi:hypothetical protein